MLINEITRGRYVYPKAKKIARAPYAKAPKPLPKPKPPILTPLQIKQKQQKNMQAYASAVQKTLASKRGVVPHPAKRPESNNSATEQNQNRSEQEMETFIKIVRGEIPR